MTAKRCEGKNRKTGEQCKNRPAKGRRFCKFHGGTTPAGRNHWNWKGGRYSRYAPNRYLQQISEALEDPQLSSLRESLALIDARLVEELQSIDEGASSEIWTKLKKQTVSAELEISKLDPEVADKTERLIKAVEGIVSTIREGASLDDKWRGLMDTIEMRAKLADRERARERDQRAFMTADQVLEFTARIVDIAADLIEDRRKFQRFIDLVTQPVAALPEARRFRNVVDAEILEEESGGSPSRSHQI